MPSGRLTVASEPTLPVGVPEEAISGCHTCVQAELVQIHFPFCSPLRRYSVRPWLLTSTVVPSAAFDAL